MLLENRFEESSFLGGLFEKAKLIPFGMIVPRYFAVDALTWFFIFSRLCNVFRRVFGRLGDLECTRSQSKSSWLGLKWNKDVERKNWQCYTKMHCQNRLSCNEGMNRTIKLKPPAKPKPSVAMGLHRNSESTHPIRPSIPCAMKRLTEAEHVESRLFP